MSEALQPVELRESQRAELGSSLARVTDMFLLAMIVGVVIPETPFGKTYISVFPLPFVFFYLALWGLVMEFAVFPRRLSLMTVATLAACLLMTVAGVGLGHSTKFIVIDLSTFCALIAGLQWGRWRSLATVVHRFYQWSIAAGVILWISMLGLVLGVVESKSAGVRRYTASILNTPCALALIAPVLLGAALSTRTSQLRKKLFRLVFALLLTVVVVAVLTATRSVFLSGVASLVVCLWVGISHRRGHVLVSFLVVVCVIGFVTYVVVRPSRRLGIASPASRGYDLYLLEDRLAATTLRAENRYKEATSMFGQLSDLEIALGTGFGSQYKLPYRKAFGPLAHTPHIAILTFLLKGGFGLFLLCIVGPGLAGILVILARPIEVMRMSCWASVLLYITVFSTAGGWRLFPMFLYGTLIAVATSRRSLEID